MEFLNRSSSATAVLKCEPSVVFEILTDYDNYFEWLPFVTHSKLLAREGELAIAEFVFVSPKQSKLSAECIHTKNKSVLTRKIAGNTHIYQLSWSLKPAQEGQTEVSIAIEKDRDWKSLISSPLKQAAAGVYLEALKSRAAIFSSQFILGEEAGRKLLEAFETDEGLTLWVLGKKYTLKPEQNND